MFLPIELNIEFGDQNIQNVQTSQNLKNQKIPQCSKSQNLKAILGSKMSNFLNIYLMELKIKFDQNAQNVLTS